MINLLAKLLQKFQDGDEAVLVTLIKSSGSTPRGAGARMIVYSDGVCDGTIGGGAVEFQAQKLAKDLLTQKRSTLKDYMLHPNQAADLGMICGGDMTVHFQYIPNTQETAGFFGHVLELCKAGDAAWLSTAFNENGDWLCATVNNNGETMLRFGELVVPDMQPETLKVGCNLEDAGELKLFTQPLNASGRVYVFGGGHVSRALLPVLSHVFFPCTVVDDIPEFANKELFPQADQVIVAPFQSAFEHIKVEPADYIVIVTRGHKFDYEVLAQALKTKARYIGMIGSRRKIDATYQRLIVNDGFNMSDIRRVNAPIGLPIGGETPEEIAVSIAAQLIAARSGK